MEGDQTLLVHQLECCFTVSFLSADKPPRVVLDNNQRGCFKCLVPMDVNMCKAKVTTNVTVHEKTNHIAANTNLRYEPK